MGEKKIILVAGTRTQNFYLIIMCTNQQARGVHVLLILSLSDPMNLATPAVSEGGKVCSHHRGNSPAHPALPSDNSP